MPRKIEFLSLSVNFLGIKDYFDEQNKMRIFLIQSGPLKKSLLIREDYA